MKPPLHIKRHLYESGESWWINDSLDNPVAQNLTKIDAELIVALVNADWNAWKERRAEGQGLPETTDTNEVDFGRCDEELK